MDVAAAEAVMEIGTEIVIGITNVAVVMMDQEVEAGTGIEVDVTVKKEGNDANKRRLASLCTL